VFAAKATVALSALLGIYSSWAWFESDLADTLMEEIPINMHWWRLLLHPFEMFRIARTLNVEGTFVEVRGLGLDAPQRVVSGWELTAIWVLEAAYIVGMSWYLSSRYLRHSLFCERCSNWAKQRLNPRVLRSSADGVPERRLAEGELDSIYELEPADYSTNPRLVLKLWECPCSGLRAYQLERQWEVIGRNGEEAASNDMNEPRLLSEGYFEVFSDPPLPDIKRSRP
jgi:hypothetical protein